ncbi:MAG: type II secretion system F family protein [Sporichthyaceae bacterium]|nr:type II secretion system F family protein [Sporichthyaceae bacterium]
MIVWMLIGAGIGFGLWLIWFGLFPPPPRLEAALATLDQRPDPSPEYPSAETGGWAARLGRPAAGWLTQLGLPGPRTTEDLILLDRSPRTHLAEKATAAAVGVLLPPATVGLLAAAGTGPGTGPALWLSAVLGAAGFFVPDLALHSQANTARAGARHALAAYLDLVVIALAGGAGVQSALTRAAEIAHSPLTDQLRAGLAEADLAHRPPWQALASLGHRLRIGELEELAASIRLAGTEGAAMRSTLATKAASIRAHDLAQAEADALSATERMSLPVVLLFAGFLIVIGYPALEHVFGVL